MPLFINGYGLLDSTLISYLVDNRLSCQHRSTYLWNCKPGISHVRFG